ncbi:MAG TPA: ATP-binding protein [Terracidiphilus sp.]|nr:ATP-binding protein [Terracidiphilus sp.]
MNMLVSGVALLIACSAFIGYDVVTFRTATLQNLSIRSQIIGSNSVSALMFNDPESAQKTLSALSADPHILSVVIYTLDGRPFASYLRPGNNQIPPPPVIPSATQEIQWISGNEIVVARHISLDGKTSGTICIRSDVGALKERLKLFVGIAALVLLASMLAALLVSSVFRRAVAMPIVRLAEVARNVSRDKNYALRVTPMKGQSEVTILIDAFNEMMEQIESSELSLHKAHDQLEQRVQERTAELESAKMEVEAYSASVLRAKEDIERASKFKDQFLSTMSHELRTPLNAVMGFSELLADRRYGPLNERQQRYVNHIHTSGQLLLQLINDILDLSKIEAGRLQLTLENVPVHASSAVVCDALQPLADKKSQTLVQHTSPELIVQADGTRLKQILMNLLGNAIKFTPEGGRIELSARKTGEQVRIEVRDSGPGIPQEEQHRIFEAFQRLKQTDKSTEGTGLGLAITKSLVELHGGQLGLESEPGVGSCFHFTLPAVSAPCEKDVPKTNSSISQTTPARILVMEDDLSAAYLLESQLASAGYEVVLSNEPQRAVEIALELKPAVITLDIVMRPVNGWEVLSKLKSDPRTAEIPVVVVTVVDRPATGALLGADEYIVKPVDRAILLSLIERCVNRRGRPDNGRSILVVEDDAPTREFIMDVLSEHGYAVMPASDGLEARARVEAGLPNLVILDLLLPEVNGFKLIAEWRVDSRTADLPIFVLTNKDLTQAERDYLQANTKALFCKHDQWKDVLIKQIQRALPSEHAE